jgi:transposase-like protein
VDKVPVSDLCDEYKLQPSVFYTWQRQLFEHMDAALGAAQTGRQPRREQELETRVKQLEGKLSKRDEVIAEISAEYVQLKKELGEP